MPHLENMGAEEDIRSAVTCPAAAVAFFSELIDIFR